ALGTGDDGGARALAEWQVEAQVGRALAEADEREIDWERSAVVRTSDGVTVEFAAIGPAIANARDRAERLALDAARAALVARELAPMRRDRFAREHEVVADMGVGGGYVDAWARLSGVDARALAAQCEQL